MEEQTNRVIENLKSKNVKPKKYFFKIDEDGKHNEMYWRREFEGVVLWLIRFISADFADLYRFFQILADFNSIFVFRRNSTKFCEIYNSDSFRNDKHMKKSSIINEKLNLAH